MKKLVTAFAACMIAGMVSAQVESLNIVGYQTVSLNQNKFTHVAPTFITIGGITQITLSQLTGNFAEGDSVQFMDSLSATASEYFYLLAGSLAPEAGATGWYANDFTTPAGNVVIPAGSSVLYSSQGSTLLTFAGEVNVANVVVNTGAGFTAVGNPFPVDTTLNAITFGGITEGSSVQFMSDIAATAAEYFYLVAGSLAPEAGATGWYADDFTTPAGTTVVAAGKGFLFSEQGTTTAITFTTPL